MRRLVVPLNTRAAVEVRSSVVSVPSLPTLKHITSENQVEHEPQTFSPNTALRIFCPLITPYEVEQ